MNSKYNIPLTESLFGGKSYDGKLALLEIGKANHFGPNDFVTHNKNQTALCAIARPPPETEFTTDRVTQENVIRTIAKVTKVALESFERWDQWKAVKKLVGRRELLVEKVEIQ